MALRLAKIGIAGVSGRTVAVQPKVARQVYQTPEHRAWRDAVVARAGGQCEAVENGVRCLKAAPEHRMFADHKVELRDGGARLDVSNGQCLCGAHHSAKTAAARSARRG